MAGRAEVSTCISSDGPEPFEVLVVTAPEPARLVLFAVGAGGDPLRHLPLLRRLADRGSTVVAPRFDRLTSTTPTGAELRLRAGRLASALGAVDGPDLPLAGVGHSIGAAMLLVLAGAQAWTRTGEQVAVSPPLGLAKLALLAPATDFFQVPGALDPVRTPTVAWAGTADGVTPPDQATFLETALGPHAPVEVRLAEGAGHFSFMDDPPPLAMEPLADRQAFLAGLAAEICQVIAG